MNDNTINFDETLPPGSGRGDETNALKPGDVLGQYRVVRLLGRGGMGEVYEVKHSTLDKRYALKLLPADFASRSDALERFKREARVMAKLEHENIVQVDDFGHTDGRYWLRMELATSFVPELGDGQAVHGIDPSFPQVPLDKVRDKVRDKVC